MVKSMTFVAEAIIEADTDEVWAVIADCTNDPRWRAGVVEMSQTPLGSVMVGTVTTERLVALGCTMSTVARVREVDHGHRFVWAAERGVDVDGIREIEAVAPGVTRFRMTLNFRAQGLMQHLMLPLLGRFLRESLRGDVRRAKAFVESNATRALVGATGGR